MPATQTLSRLYKTPSCHRESRWEYSIGPKAPNPGQESRADAFGWGGDLRLELVGRPGHLAPHLDLPGGHTRFGIWSEISVYLGSVHGAQQVSDWWRTRDWPRPCATGDRAWHAPRRVTGRGAPCPRRPAPSSSSSARRARAAHPRLRSPSGPQSVCACRANVIHYANPIVYYYYYLLSKSMDPDPEPSVRVRGGKKGAPALARRAILLGGRGLGRPGGEECLGLAHRSLRLGHRRHLPRPTAPSPASKSLPAPYAACQKSSARSAGEGARG